MEGVARLGSGTNGDSGLHAHGDTAEGLGSRPGAGARRALLERGGGGSGLAPGWPGGLLSPPRGDNSNSSWAEMELDVIGHFDVFPLTTQVKLQIFIKLLVLHRLFLTQVSQIFILRLLTPLAEYQDFLALTQGTKILEILETYINVRESKDAR